MNRLLSGDVGSGKTVVAAVAAYLTALAGKKAVLMVPTSILATQHFETFCKLFEKYDIKIGLITSERQDFNRTTYNALGIKESEKKLNTKCVIQNTDILIGTHALIQPGMKIDGLALTIVDEQHRFGVRQREALRHLAGKKQDTRNNNQTNFKNQLPKTNLQEMAPHFLSMTATPIPRTMYLALFGDLDVSFLIEKPANRKPVKTRVVDEFNRDKAYRFIRELIKHGRQVFVVCPLVEEQGTGNNGQSDRVTERQRDFFEDERKAVKSEVEKLKAVFPEFEIAMLHGRMKAKDKDAIMADFVANKVQILVSTSVVEVGVDVPNAAVMVVEDAERFGLATLHQFRGRVGRADHQSFCFLFSQTQSEKAIQRLQSLEKISDGYKLAEIDLKTRGFGSILGTEQSGILDMKMADFSDKMLVSMAGEAAKSIADEIDKYPLVMKKISELNTSKHLE